MRNALLKRVRPLIDRLAAELTDIALARVETELERINQAFDVAISAYASDGTRDLLTAALGPDLAAMLTPTKRKRDRNYTPNDYPASRRAREERAVPQVTGAKPVTCSKCGFVGGNARGCGTAHPTQPTTVRETTKPENKHGRIPATAEVTTHGKPRRRSVMRCGKCGAVGYRSDGCGRSHQPQGGTDEPSATDSDDEPARAAPKRTTRNLQATYEMITRAQNGDRAAMTELVRQNTGLVHWVARRHGWSSLPYEDMVQEGLVGLVEAIKRFDVSRGLQLSTYAPAWIRHFIGRASENDGLIRLPIPSHHQLRLVHRAQKSAGPDATIDDIAQRAGLRVKAVRRLLERGTVTQPAKLPDVALPADNDNEGELAIAREHIAALPDRERRVMELRYLGDGMTLLEVGNVLGVSRERVRQVETKALRAIRSRLEAEAASA